MSLIGGKELARRRAGTVVLRDAEGGLEDVRLDDGELDVGCNGFFACCDELVIDFPQRSVQFSTDADPFGGFEVVVLEDEDERRGLEEGDVAT